VFEDELSFPETSWRDRLIATAIFGISLIHFRWFYDFGLISPDEGIVLQGAQRILSGQVIYRDFFSFLTPGSYYWTAFLFTIFGNSFLVARAALMVEGALFSVVTYLLARRVCSRWSASVGALCVTLTALPSQFFVLHNWDSTLWACLALYAAIWFLQRPGRLPLFIASMSSALTCLFEQSKGAGITAGLVLGFLLLAAIDRKGLPGLGWSWLWVPGAGFALPFLLTFTYFALMHGLPEMAEQWLWPLWNYSDVNKTPYGFVILSPEARQSMAAEPWTARVVTTLLTGPLYMIPFLPVIALATLGYWIFKSRAGKCSQSKCGYYVVVSSAVIGLIASAFATRRPDFVHLVFLSPILVVTPLVIVSFLAFGLVLASRPLNAHETVRTRRGTLRNMYPDAVLQYIQTKVQPGQRILIYPYIPLYYYLTATFSPSRYEYLQAGLHRPDQFQELVREIEQNQTALVFLEPSFTKKLASSFPSSPSDFDDPVTAYIETHYKTCANLTSQNYWNLVAMVRNDLSCP
jgi:hypothetical protein